MPLPETTISRVERERERALWKAPKYKRATDLATCSAVMGWVPGNCSWNIALRSSVLDEPPFELCAIGAAGLLAASSVQCLVRCLRLASISATFPTT
jgi:hypothetical protein